MSTSEVGIPVGDADWVRGYVARPAPGRSLRRGIVLVHEAFGPTPWSRDIARRFATRGYGVAMPDLYTSLGQPNPDDMADCVAKMYRLDDRAVSGHLRAASSYLRGALDCDSVAIVGFCMGGRLALLEACLWPEFAAAVSCWGGQVFEGGTPNRPHSLFDSLSGLSCPALVVGGAEDTDPSPEHLGAVRERLRNHQDVSVLVYEGAGHAFLNDSRPIRYREQQAFELWDRMTEFLDRHLRG